jgi:hypothetical protein
MFAVRKSIIRSIVDAGGKATATFVLNSDRGPMELANKPITLSDIGFEVQRVKNSR